MCGIAGFIDINRKSEEGFIRSMTDSIKHRGPDGDGAWFHQTVQYQVGFGHRRLSIIDLSTAAGQPMHYKQFSLIFNGEIYNYNEIRNELLNAGHEFLTHSDTEVILHAFEEWGIAVINRFIGMFAFVLFDQQSQKLLCVRDRVGVKPLYYYWKEDLFLFASELKAFHAHPHFQKELNLDSVASFLQYGYVPAPNCIFKNAFKLKPGHYLSFDITNRRLDEVQYWNVYDYYNLPKNDISFNESITETTSILKKAFQYRMVADVPVGVFLSGGYDSACVAALLQEGNPERLKTFTIGIPKMGMDEAPYAKAVSKHLGTDHTEYYCTEKEALDIIPTLPYFYDEPFADSSAIPTMLVSRIARQSVTVALSADAGDETFAGYTRYDSMRRYTRSLKRIPKLLRTSAASIMEMVQPAIIPVLGKKYGFVNGYQKLRKLLVNPEITEVLHSSAKQFYGEDLQSLLKVPIREQPTAFDSKELGVQYFEEMLYLMAMDYQTFLPDDILQKVDRATMSVSLEGREPFLDHNVIQWAAQLPTSFKHHNGNTKYILKEIVHRYIPRDMMDRPKMGFSIPVGDWMEGELQPLLHHYFSKEFLEKQGIFKPEPVMRIKHSFLNGRLERSEKIWVLLMFQMWFEKWMK